MGSSHSGPGMLCCCWGSACDDWPGGRVRTRCFVSCQPPGIKSLEHEALMSQMEQAWTKESARLRI